MRCKVTPETFAEAQSGSHRAFARLHEEVEPCVRWFASRLIGLPWVDDIVQKTMTALYINIGKIACVDSLLPYVFRVVRNFCYEDLRREGRFNPPPRQRRGQNDEERDPLHVRDQNRLADETAGVLELAHEVARALNELPELQREALILFAEGDLTYAQIAEAMHSDIGTIKSRIFSARKNVIKRINPRVLDELGIGKEITNGV